MVWVTLQDGKTKYLEGTFEAHETAREKGLEKAKLHHLRFCSLFQCGTVLHFDAECEYRDYACRVHATLVGDQLLF